MFRKMLQDYLLRKMREAVNNACKEDKEALQEILDIATTNIDKLEEDDILKLLADIDAGEGREYRSTAITIHERK